MAKRNRRSGWQFWRWRIWRSRWFLIPVGTLLVLVLIVGGVLYWRLRPMIESGKAVQAQAMVLKADAKNQDLTALAHDLPVLQTKLTTLQQQVQWFSFTKSWPWLGAYYSDTEHAFLAAAAGIRGGQTIIEGVTPYADVLGFKTNQPVVSQSTEDRIAQLTLLMPSLLPVLDKAQGDFESLKTEVDAIDVHRYPGKIGSVDLHSSLQQVKDQVDGLEAGIAEARPLLSVLPSVMGAPTTKKYLVLFQNDKELRPTGGFITSVAYITFNQGSFHITDPGDIYSIDNGKAYLPIPKPIQQYLNVPQWYMRDTNFSPDFVQSMTDFQYYYTKSKDPAIDGIIAVDTQFVEGLMTLTGPISVSGYKQPFSADSITVNGTSIPQVVYQLELVSEHSGGGVERKSILGDLMQAIVKKLLSAPASSWPSYIKEIQTQGQQKHILLNFHDPKAQQLAEDQNFAGRIVAAKGGQDYLHISDANLAGLKSNLYLTQQTTQAITIDADGTVHEKLAITYANTGKFDGWLNANAHNYLRVYVPLGSKLVKSSGGDQKTTTTTDLGKTVFDNFVLVHPLEHRTVTLEYTLPFKVQGNYSELIQKQPGAKNWNYSVEVNGKSQSVLIDGDKTISAKQ